MQLWQLITLAQTLAPMLMIAAVVASQRAAALGRCGGAFRAAATRRAAFAATAMSGEAALDGTFAALGRRACEAVGEASEGGRLYVVPTPLGEVSDLTFRAVAVLARADFVACEDTRRAGDLFARLGIARASRGEFVRHDLQTAGASSGRLLEAMARGDSVALVSDAGTPCISDPGSLLVREAARNGFRVVALPGACAATTALSASGFDCARRGFAFHGFVEGRGAQAKREQGLAAALASADRGGTRVVRRRFNVGGFEGTPGKGIHALSSPREMSARPKKSQNEWTTTEIGGFKKLDMSRPFPAQAPTTRRRSSTSRRSASGRSSTA